MEFRKYQSGDESAILELFELVFGSDLGVDYWNWRFRDNPTKKQMILLCWDEAKLVGHYAVSPVKMRVGAGERMAGLSMTTMTHPDYGGQGIFKKLAEELYQTFYKDEGLDFIWGFPNKNSHGAFIKNLRWKDIQVMPSFSLSIIDAYKPIAEKSLNSFDTFEERHVSSLNKQSADFFVAVVKDTNYLNWRYIDNPINDYDLFEFEDGEFVVCKKFPSFDVKGAFEVDIIECSISNDLAKIKQMIGHVIGSYGDIIKINTWMSLNDARHITFERAGFHIIGPNTYQGIRVMNDNLSVDQMSNSKEWYLSMGDSDVY